MTEPLLSVRDLDVHFTTPAGRVEAVKKVSFDIAKGETLALVGESGSGKSVTALSILQLLPYPMASHPDGSIRFRGQELVGATERNLRGVRGNQISMIFQEPMTSLNPLHTVEKQINEMLLLHKGLSGAAARARVLELLELVGIPNAAQRLTAYPHELSGGQRQRVMIAMALANEPDLLIADEPTTALDVTIQAQILKLLNELQERFGMAILFITHDLGVVAKVAGRVCVMQNGEIVERGATRAVFDAPKHPYTRKLIEAEPKGEKTPAAMDAPVVMRAADVKVWFPIKKGVLRRTVDHVRAVDGISLAVHEGQTVGVVGESGSGKTTLGRTLLRLLPSDGEIRFDGEDIRGWSANELRGLRKDLQIVFQDPYGSLSPRMTVGEIVAEGLLVHEPGLSQRERDLRCGAVLEEVRLDKATRNRYPHEFSGGQRQRIAIARALILKPKVIVLDEPTSALDRSVQKQIIELLRDLQTEHGLSYIFISHDLAVVRALADEVLVMKDGRCVEQGTTDAIFAVPRDAYTRALIAAAFDLAAVEPEAVAG